MVTDYLQQLWSKQESSDESECTSTKFDKNGRFGTDKSYGTRGYLSPRKLQHQKESYDD